MSFRRQLPSIALIVFLAFVALVLLVPIAWTLTTSFKTVSEIQIVPPPFFPHSFLNFGNYLTVIHKMHFLHLILNTMLACAAVLCGSLVFTSLAGYGFAKFNFPGKEVAFFLIIGVLMVPFQSVAVPLVQWVDSMGLYDTFLGLILPLVISAFGVLLMRESITAIPNDYIEAARIDGSSELRTYAQIILPMIKPSLAALAVIKFIWTWNEFFWPLLIISTPTKAVVTLGLSYFSNMYFQQYNLITAGAVLSLLPLFLMFAILRGGMVKALTGVGVKG